MRETKPGRILSIEAAAQKLGMSQKAVYQAVFRKQVPYRKWGRRLVFLESELDAFIDSLGVRVSLEEARQRQQEVGA
jgi:predicted DNA-binding transcriptional regulator AlpA